MHIMVKLPIIKDQERESYRQYEKPIRLTVDFSTEIEVSDWKTMGWYFQILQRKKKPSNQEIYTQWSYLLEEKDK